jgi:hypothetical protein
MARQIAMGWTTSDSFTKSGISCIKLFHNCLR